MSAEDSEKVGEDLTPNQKQNLDRFIQTGRAFLGTDPQMVAYFDQSSAFFRDALKGRFGLDLKAIEDYYLVVAGLEIGILWQYGIVNRGDMAADGAGLAMRVALSRLAPPGIDLDPEAEVGVAIVGDVEQASEMLKSALTVIHDLDLENPYVFRLANIGLTLGTEWVEGLVSKGLSIENACTVTGASLASIYPGQA